MQAMTTEYLSDNPTRQDGRLNPQLEGRTLEKLLIFRLKQDGEKRSPTLAFLEVRFMKRIKPAHDLPRDG